MCRQHANGIGDKILCRKQITYGDAEAECELLTDEQCITGLKRWLLTGFAILDSIPGRRGGRRHQHLDVNARHLALRAAAPAEDAQQQR